MNITAITFRLRASWVYSMMEEIALFVVENYEAEILWETYEIR